MPLLVPDPAAWRALWQSRLDDYLFFTETRLRALRQEAELPDLLPRTRSRVLRVANALENQRVRVRELFADVAAREPLLPASVSSSGSPDELPILECFENVFRDWVWGATEIAKSLESVRRAAPEVRGRVAVFGVGAGRLAWELHRMWSPDATFALDINPLPLLIAARLLGGGALDLHEFPVAPRSGEEVAVLQHLEPVDGTAPGFELIVADAFRPPFPPASLDAVITPWFIDAARADFRETAAAVNEVLRREGTWINVGPLRFNNVLSRCYTIEEVFDVVQASGFAVLSQHRDDLPYFDSPWSGSRRTDTVFSFAAQKHAESPSPEPASATPPWLLDPRLPIPLTPAMNARRRASVFAVGVISLLDGHRSMLDLARVLGQKWGVDPRVAQDQLTAFFAKMTSSA